MVSTWSIGGKTVQSLVINNKEVQSIVRNNDGNVLYEKASVPNYSIAFGQSSYTATNGACTISCTLLYNGSPVNDVVLTVANSDNSFYQAITDQNGVAVFNLINLTTTITCTCTYANVTATCTVTSNYVPPTPIGWNMPLTSYTVTDPYDIISGTYGEPYFAIHYFDSYIDNYEDLINYDNSDKYFDLGRSFYPEDFPIDITDEENVNNGYWVNPIMIYLVNVNVYLLCSYELIDGDTLVAKVTDNIFE